MTHAQMEERLHTDCLELMTQLLQDSFDLRASREQRLSEVYDHNAAAERPPNPAGHGPSPPSSATCTSPGSPTAVVA